MVSELKKIVKSGEFVYVDSEIMSWSNKQDVDGGILYCVVKSEVRPVDGRKWSQDRVTVKNIKQVVSKFEDLYWEAFRNTMVVEVLNKIEEWNSWCDYSPAKLLRILGGSAKVRKVYIMGRGYKDMFVITYLCKCKNFSLEVLFKNLLSRVRDVELIEPWCWKWSRFDIFDKPQQSKYGGVIKVG